MNNRMVRARYGFSKILVSLIANNVSYLERASAHSVKSGTVEAPMPSERAARVRQYDGSRELRSLADALAKLQDLDDFSEPETATIKTIEAQPSVWRHSLSCQR